MKKIHLLLFILPMFLALAGCTHLDYVKVPTPTQYDKWTDAQQAQADSMKGVRYYLPRPFVNLKQSVPVAQRVAFVTFVYDDKTDSYLLKLPVDAPIWLQRVAPTKLSVLQAVAASTTSAGGTKGSAGNQQAGSVGDTNTPAASSSSGTPAPETPAQTLSASVGYINDTDPVTRLGDLMDVVYLPDFEEQYVIQPHTGFAGQANIEAKLRNGWAAETFAQKTDNSQLIPYVIRQFQNASDTAAKIATTWYPTAAAGLPPGTSLSDVMKFASKGASALAGNNQAGNVGGGTGAQTAQDFLGKTLIFKIAEVRIAQPGLYPILKPREILHWFHAPQPPGVVDPHADSQQVFDLFLQRANVPWIREDMAFIPCPPFTVIGFNTTSDVFLTPATERIKMDAPTGPPQQQKGAPPADADNEFTAKIKAAIVKALPGAANPEIKAVTEQGVVVKSQENGTILVKLQSADNVLFKKPNAQVYSSWVGTTLALVAGETVDLAAITTDTTNLISFTIKGSASAIAERLH